MKARFTISRRFVILALAADKISDKKTIVFKYNGHDKLKRYAETISARGINYLLKEINVLESDVKTSVSDMFPYFRQSYLLSQIRSLRKLIQIGNREMYGRDLFDACSDIIGVKPIKPFNIGSIKRPLKLVLDKYGYNSYEEYEREKIATDRPVTRQKVREKISEMLKMCCRDVLPLIAHGSDLTNMIRSSKVRLESPKKGYPPCYFIYSGRGRATICLSKYHLSSESVAIRTIMHELFPGHLLTALYRDLLAKIRLIGNEAELDLLCSAETPIIEGVAEYAPRFIRMSNSKMQMCVEIENEWDHFCKKVMYNAWYSLFIEGNISRREAINYIINETGIKLQKAMKLVDFIDAWRIYFPSYPLGIDIVERHIRRQLKGSVAYLYLPRTAKTLSLFERHCRNSNAFEKGD